MKLSKNRVVKIHSRCTKYDILYYIFKIVISKNTFGYDNWVRVLDNWIDTIDEIEICGLCTDICVISNAFIIKAKLHELKITCDGNACAGVTPESHANALNAMKMCQVNVI